MKTTLKIIVWALAVGSLCLLSLCFYALRDTKPETQLHTAKVSWLPSDAKDVSKRWKEGLASSEEVECTLPVAEFRKLAAQRGWKLEEIKNRIIYRRIPGLPPLRELPELERSIQTESPGLKIDIIENGLFAESRQPNGGGYTAWYDLDLQRMIYVWGNR